MRKSNVLLYSFVFLFRYYYVRGEIMIICFDWFFFRFLFKKIITVTFAITVLCGLAVTIVLFCKSKLKTPTVAFIVYCTGAVKTNSIFLGRSKIPKKEKDIEEHQGLVDDHMIKKGIYFVILWF